MTALKPVPAKIPLAEWRAAVPAPLREQRRWCGWCGTKKPLALATGRNAKTDNPATWGTFDEACAWYAKHEKRPDAGVGFVTGDGTGALDFDDAREPTTGEPLGWVAAEVHAARSATYTEVSPSGKGFRSLVVGGDGMVEFKPGKAPSFKPHQFVTITGRRVGETAEMAPAPESLQRLFARGAAPKPPKAAREDGPDTARVKSALEAIDPDVGHDEWLRVGMALHHGYGGDAEGLLLWDEWSAAGGKYQKGEPAQRWGSFKPERGVTLGTLFHLALEHGWSDARSPEEEFEPVRGPDGSGGPIPGVSGCMKGRRWVGDKTARNIELTLAHVYADQLELDTRAGAVLLCGRRLEEGSERNALAANVAEALGWNQDPQVGSLRAGIAGAAARFAFDPVVRYLDGLPSWDRVPRFEELARALGVEAGEVANSSELLRRWCLGAVRRAREPGVKMDNTLVLLGEQGLRKTESLRTLAEVVPDTATPLFTRASARIKDKDGRIALQGPWIVELAELAEVRTAENAVVKAFLDEREDWFRPPYAETNVRRPRRVAMAGTTNDPEFLNDSTGARRYWPVAIEARIDLEWIRDHRDALWAEADARCKGGEPHWFAVDPDWLRTRHEDAHEEDALDEEVEEVIRQHTEVWRERGWFRVMDVLACIPPNSLRSARSPSNAVGAKLRRLGFRKVQMRLDTTRKKVWVNPAWPPPLEKEEAHGDLDDLL